MVDAVVSYVVQSLGDFLVEKAVFLQGVKNEVKRLKDELGWIQCFLKDAEEKQYGDALICKWVSDIRELAYDIEDVLNIFHLKVRSQAVCGPTMEGKQKFGCFSSVCSCMFNKGKENVNMYNIGKEVEELNSRINDLSRRRESYGLRDSGNRGEERGCGLGTRLRELRRSTSFAVEENVVGFEDDAQLLLGKVLDEDPQRLVVSIYGMGGLGKTTLARKIYHNNDVRTRFMNCCAWVSVSQEYTTRDLLQRIIRSFNIGKKNEDQEKMKDLEMMKDLEKMKDVEKMMELEKMKDLEKMNEEDLGRYLYESLQDRSYMVVIDDVWDKEAWESLKRAFPDKKNGSRVIITTRIKEVAERSDERTYAHKLRYLRPKESWQLFCEKAFQNLNPDEGLEELGRQMVQKCDGLPLAIIVLGGLLSTKKPKEWRVVRDHIWQRLKNDSIEISNLLALSFDDLRYHLKQCFLYLGLFPEDYEICMEKLIHLLVAEDFIRQDEDHTMEDVAKDYLDQLINRSLIQVEKAEWGRIATCRVHDLLRDLAIEKAKNLNFFFVYDELKHANISSVTSSCPRQAVYFGTTRWLQECNSRLRSLLVFDTSGRGQLIPICSKFNSLRVLDVGFDIDENQQMLPKVVRKLIHLKYLRLNGRRVDLSSWSISDLQRLQTLDVSEIKNYVKLPAEICKLQELRHLIGKFSYGLLPIDNLTKLQTLRYVINEIWTGIKTEKLVNLRELWLHGYLKQDVFTFDSISNLKSLQILSVTIDDYKSFASLQQLSHCPHLVDLRLWGKIETLPEDIHELWPNLECLSLGESQLKDDPMPVLEKLPNLIVLDFGPRFFRGEKIMCTARGFPQLEILRFDVVDEIQDWQVEEGALPRLRGLWIQNNSELTIPERLRSIPPPDIWECKRTFV